jgi:cytosine/adenosine deaminase-related metal-dependent hydrolase
MAVLIWAEMALVGTDVETDYAIVVEGDRITAAGAHATLTAQFPNAQPFGGRAFLMLPGFVNAHDHGRAVGSAALGVPDDMLECWLLMLGAQPQLPPDLATAYDAVQLLKSGVTTTAHSHNPATWAGMFDECPLAIQGYRQAGIRVAFHPPMVDQNMLVYADQAAFTAGLPVALQPEARARSAAPPFSTGEYLARLTDLYDRYHDSANHTVHIQASPAGGQWCSDELIIACGEWAHARHSRMQMHMLETRYQRHYALKTWRKTFIRHLHDLGVLSEWLTLAHMVWADEADFDLLRERAVGVVHNPSSNLRLRSGIAPVARMRSAGIRLGIGLDGHALDDDQDYWRELRLAWTLGHLVGTDSEALTAQAVLAMATEDGARMTLPGAPLGRLRPGALADVVLIDVDAVRGEWAAAGYPDPLDLQAFLLRRASRRHVRQVMVGGVWKVRDGVCVTVDEAAVAREISARIAQQDADELRKRMAAARALAPYIRAHYAAWDDGG